MDRLTIKVYKGSPLIGELGTVLNQSNVKIERITRGDMASSKVDQILKENDYITISGDMDAVVSASSLCFMK